MTRNQTIDDRTYESFFRSLGPTIRAALADDGVAEIMVNPDGRLRIERFGVGRVDTGEVIAVHDRLTIIQLVAHHLGETVSHAAPRLSATLPRTGQRFQAALPPIADQPTFCIRKQPSRIFTLDDYVAAASLTAAGARILRTAAAARDTLLISGGTGSGKTTLANALLAEPAYAGDRLLILEDTRELQSSAADTIQLLTRRDPAVTMRDLLRDTLRFRPDRIIVGEVRDGAALDMIKAWNTGHPGGLSTLHANSAGDALFRLEDLVREVAATVPRRAIAGAIDLIVHLRRTPSGRRVETIARVLGLTAEGGYDLEPLNL